MCAFVFPRVFRTTKESVLGRSEDCLCCQLLEWKLHVDLTVKQVHLGSTHFQLLYSAVGRLEGFILEALRVKPSE